MIRLTLEVDAPTPADAYAASFRTLEHLERLDPPTGRLTEESSTIALCLDVVEDPPDPEPTVTVRAVRDALAETIGGLIQTHPGPEGQPTRDLLGGALLELLGLELLGFPAPPSVGDAP